LGRVFFGRLNFMLRLDVFSVAGPVSSPGLPARA